MGNGHDELFKTPSVAQLNQSKASLASEAERITLYCMYVDRPQSSTAL